MGSFLLPISDAPACSRHAHQLFCCDFLHHLDLEVALRGQMAPRTAAAHDVENAVDDLAQRPTARAADALGGRQIRLDHALFLIGHIALVAQTVAAIVLTGGWGPHGNSESVSVTARNHVDFSHSILSKRPLKQTNGLRIKPLKTRKLPIILLRTKMLTRLLLITLR